ncbi:LysR substrate-binding domain-containing protein [Streptomyces syringium]
MDDPMSAVLPVGHRLADRASLDLAELVRERWVMGCMKAQAFMHRYAELAGSELRVSAATTDFFFAQTLVAAGVGVSLVPRIALDPTVGGVVVIPIDPPRPARYIGVATASRHRGRPQPHVEALLAALVRSVP